MKLGGWIRLWIAICVLHGFALLALAWVLWMTSQQIDGSDVFIGLAWWLVVSLSLYVIGWSVGWIVPD